MLRFYGLRVLKDYLGHVILIGLPIFMITFMSYINTPEGESVAAVAGTITIAFLLMFHIFGAAYTHEGIEKDFFTPMRMRLKAAPVNPVRFIVAMIVYSVLISFAQTLVILAYSMVVLGAAFQNLPLVLLLFIINIVFSQLMAAVVILKLKKAAKAQAVMMAYAIGGPVLAGFMFPLPENTFTRFLERYSTPVAHIRTAITGVLNSDTTDIVLGAALALAFIAIITVVLVRLSESVKT